MISVRGAESLQISNLTAYQNWIGSPSISNPFGSLSFSPVPSTYFKGIPVFLECLDTDTSITL